MANKQCYDLPEFKNGDYMLWDVCSQTYGNFVVRLKDDKNTYMEIQKTNHSQDLQRLTQNACFY